MNYQWEDPKNEKELELLIEKMKYLDLDEIVSNIGNQKEDYQHGEAVELEENLFQGNEDAFIFHRADYDAVLAVYEGNRVDLHWNNPQFYLNIKAPDGPGFTEKMMDMSIKFLLDTHAEGHKTLIHCKAGISRSVVVAGVYYALLNRVSLIDGVKRIQDLKNKSGYWKSKWYNSVHPSEFVWAVGEEYLKNNRESFYEIKRLKNV